MGLQRCVNSCFTRTLNSSAKALQVVKPLIIEVYIVANANGTGQVTVFFLFIYLFFLLLSANEKSTFA